MLNLSNIEIENYVIVDNELKKISTSTISLSKNLSKLSNLNTEGK